MYIRTLFKGSCDTSNILAEEMKEKMSMVNENDAPSASKNARPYDLLKEVFQRLKRKHMHLILLAATIFVTYWTFFFWVTIIKTLQLYTAGDDIYNLIHLETPETKGNASAVHIPRIIHRMWANDEFLKQDNLEITHSFIRCNSLYHRKNWTTILWTDESIRNFLQKHYSHFISTFDAYPYTIQRVDAARYFILYHYGGVYMDMDIGCFSTKDIGDFVNYMEASGKQVALPQTEPVGLSNDVMIASKNSTFFKEAIDALPTKNRWFGMHYLTVLYSTGSLFLSLLFFNQKPLERNKIAIIPPRLYTEKGTRYFRHLHGSTWHGKDQWIVKNWFAIVLFFAIALLLLLLTKLRPLRIRTTQSKLK